MTADEKLERELESFLAEENSRVAALYRKLPRHEPDSRIDDAVLAMARRAVAPPRRRTAWMPALSAAALVVVAAGIAYRSAPQVWNDRNAEMPHNATQLDTPAPAAQTMSAPPTMSASSATSHRLAREIAAPPAAPSEAPPAASKDVAKTARPGPLPAMPMKRKRAPAVPAAAPPPAPESEQLGQLRDDKTAAPPMPATAAMQANDAVRFEQSKVRDQSVEEADKSLSGGTASVGADIRAKPAPSPAVRAVDSYANAPASAPAAAPLSPSDKAESNLYPDHWLADIRIMLRDNRRDDALRNLANFRRKYPDYSLPDDLRDLK